MAIFREGGIPLKCTEMRVLTRSIARSVAWKIVSRTGDEIFRSSSGIRRKSICRPLPCNGVLRGRHKSHVAFPPCPAACAMDSDGCLGYSLSMSADWNRKSILRFLGEGCTLGEAARLAGVHRQTLLRWRWESPEFAESVAVALATGKDERTYRMWLRHPFRGMRPPTGKGNGGSPRFTYGRR